MSDAADPVVQLVDTLLNLLLFHVELYNSNEERIDSAVLLREEYEYGEAPIWLGSIGGPPVGVVGAVDDPERTYRALSAGAVGMLAAKVRSEGPSLLLDETVRSTGELLGGLAKMARVRKPLLKSIVEAFAPGDLAEWAQRGGEIASALSGGDREIDAFVAALPAGAGPRSSAVAASPQPRPSGGGVVDINTAARTRLQQIPGVGRVIAERIIAGRPFRSIDEVAGVSGVGPQTMEAIRSSAAVFDDEEGSAHESLDDGGLVSRPDVITIRFRTGEDGSVTKLIPDTGSEFPFDEPYVDDRSQVLAALQQSVAPLHYDAGFQAEVGQQLMDALMRSPLPGSGGHELVELHKAAFDATGGLVTWQLSFDEGSFRAAQLPWELVGDKYGHAVADERARINRYITYFGDREPFEQVDPLRVLYLESRPKDAGSLPDITGAYAEAVERLGERIQTVLVRHATFADLESALTAGSFHVVHYDGHGYFDGVNGFLLFEDGSRNTDWVTAERLVGVLEGSGVRLVVLGACQGSTVGGMGMFQSTAPALIRAGIPAVVANQFSVYVDAEKAFTNEFYASIARGESISAAVADGRKAMAPYRGHFFLPTLYLRVADGEGYLFGGEPETHRRWRMTEMQKLSAWWWAMSELQRARYREGILRWDGREVQPAELPPVRWYPSTPPPADDDQVPTEATGTPAGDPGQITRGPRELTDLAGTYEFLGVRNRALWEVGGDWRGIAPPQIPAAAVTARRMQVIQSGTEIRVRALPEPDVLAFEFTGELDLNTSERHFPRTVTREKDGRWEEVENPEVPTGWRFIAPTAEFEFMRGRAGDGLRERETITGWRDLYFEALTDSEVAELKAIAHAKKASNDEEIRENVARGGYFHCAVDLLVPQEITDPPIALQITGLYLTNNFWIGSYLRVSG